MDHFLCSPCKDGVATHSLTTHHTLHTHLLRHRQSTTAQLGATLTNASGFFCCFAFFFLLMTIPACSMSLPFGGHHSRAFWRNLSSGSGILLRQHLAGRWCNRWLPYLIKARPLPTPPRCSPAHLTPAGPQRLYLTHNGTWTRHAHSVRLQLQTKICSKSSALPWNEEETRHSTEKCKMHPRQKKKNPQQNVKVVFLHTTTLAVQSQT